jgi:Ion channel
MWPLLGVAGIVYAFAGDKRQDGVSPATIVGLGAFSAFIGGIIIMRLLNPEEDLLAIASGALITLIVLICSFSLLYYKAGAEGHWSQRLTHLDALLLTIGTLTTAGTGDLQAHSEIARGLLLAQMSVDLVVVTGMITIFLARIASHRRE